MNECNNDKLSIFLDKTELNQIYEICDIINFMNLF